MSIAQSSLAAKFRVTELKDHFRIAHGEAINVGYAPPQNEGVVCIGGVRRVEENDFSDIGPQANLWVGDKPDSEFFRRALHELAEVAETVDRGEAVGLQDDFGFEVLNAS